MPIYQTKLFDLLALLQSIILTLYHLAAAKCKTNWVEHSKHIVYVYATIHSVVKLRYEFNEKDH